jgi:hypothetical protein
MSGGNSESEIIYQHQWRKAAASAKIMAALAWQYLS